MAHPRQLIEALMKRLLDAKKVNTRQQRTARNPAPEGGYENVEGGIARENLNEVLEADFTADKLRQARQEVRGAQGRDPLEQPVGDTIVPGEMMESSVREPVRDPSRLPDLAPEDPLKRPVESGLSRYLPEENIHEPMMPRTRDGSVRSRDPSRLPKSPDPIQDDVISNMPRPNPQEDAQKLFETLFNDAARGRDVDPRSLSMLDDMYPPYADIVEMEMKAQGKGIGGASIADDLDEALGPGYAAQADQGGLTGLRGKDRLLGESGDLSPGEAGYGAQVERVGRLKHTGSRQDLDKKLSLLSRVITDQAEKAGAEGVNKDLIRMMEELELGSGKKLMQRLFNQEFNPLDDIPF